ncbi:glycoside hydrolase family 16 protein [Sorangium sp. So ce1036]|uniref:hypothetical protein n=1 Tax=Sorangium sp. So ce1036 TaxID=3133328 RepID=UPI003F0B2778
MTRRAGRWSRVVVPCSAVAALVAAVGACSLAMDMEPLQGGAPDEVPGGTCEGGEKRCDGRCVPTSDPASGCSAASCAPCEIAHGTPACVAGGCSVGACDPGFDDCNDSAADGCEVAVSSDQAHCGSCDNPCPEGLTCTDGACSDPNFVEEFWDDLNYSDLNDVNLIKNGWAVRTTPGKPGVSGATWDPYIVEFTPEHGNPDNRVITVVASTEGYLGSSTRHTEVHTTDYRFLHGTYAARIYFLEAPETGPDTDSAVQAFFTFGPSAASDDPERGYGGMNAMYLPNGGMEQPVQTMRLTTRGISDPSAITSTSAVMAQGWHTIVVTANSATREITYSIDGVRVATHRDLPDLSVYPEAAMRLGFSLWFLDGELDTSDNTPRTYYQVMDWVYHAKDRILTRAEVELKVAELRKAEVTFKDTLP